MACMSPRNLYKQCKHPCKVGPHFTPIWLASYILDSFCQKVNSKQEKGTPRNRKFIYCANKFVIHVSTRRFLHEKICWIIYCKKKKKQHICVFQFYSKTILFKTINCTRINTSHTLFPDYFIVSLQATMNCSATTNSVHASFIRNAIF